MYKLISIHLKLLRRNKRLKDVLVLLFFTGIAIWAMAIHESLTQKGIYSYNHSTYVVSLTIIAFIIPITLTSNLFSFFFSIIRFSMFFTNYNEHQITKSFIILFAMLNLYYNLIFLSPLFLINNEIEELLALTLLSTGIGIPVSILISSLKITSIDLSKSKTHNYSGLNTKIIFLTIMLVVFSFLLFYLSKVIFNVKMVLPLLLGLIGVLILPFWVKTIRNRLFKIKNEFGL